MSEPAIYKDTGCKQAFRVSLCGPLSEFTRDRQVRWLDMLLVDVSRCTVGEKWK